MNLLLILFSLVDPSGKVRPDITNENGNPNYKYFYNNADQGEAVKKELVLRNEAVLVFVARLWLQFKSSVFFFLKQPFVIMVPPLLHSKHPKSRKLSVWFHVVSPLDITSVLYYVFSSLGLFFFFFLLVFLL